MTIRKLKRICIIFVSKVFAMKHTNKILAVSLLLFIGVLYSYADRGLRKKSKNSVVLNVKTGPSFNAALGYNLKTGLKYTGMLNYSSLKGNNIKNEYINRTINSYKKGNTIYIVPKYRTVTSDFHKCYTGIKLTLFSH